MRSYWKSFETVWKMSLWDLTLVFVVVLEKSSVLHKLCTTVKMHCLHLKKETNIFFLSTGSEKKKTLNYCPNNWSLHWIGIQWRVSHFLSLESTEGMTTELWQVADGTCHFLLTHAHYTALLIHYVFYQEENHLIE